MVSVRNGVMLAVETSANWRCRVGPLQQVPGGADLAVGEELDLQCTAAPLVDLIGEEPVGHGGRRR